MENTSKFEKFFLRTVLIEKIKIFHILDITGIPLSTSFKKCDNFDEITYICNKTYTSFNSVFFWEIVEQYKKHFIEIHSDGTYGTHCKITDAV